MFDHMKRDLKFLSTNLWYSVNGSNKMNSYKNKSGGAKSHMYTIDHKIKCKLKF